MTAIQNGLAGKQHLLSHDWAPAWPQPVAANEGEMETRCNAGRGVNDITTKVRH